jgi:hypothetical protein
VHDDEPGDRAGQDDGEPAQPAGLRLDDLGGLDDDAVELQPLGDRGRDEGEARRCAAAGAPRGR